MIKNDLLLQIYVPFCVRRCAHCSRRISKYDPDLAAAYAKALLSEIEAAAPDAEGRTVTAIAFEGGSPALLAPGDLQAILRAVKKHFVLAEDVQISLQTMPGDYSRSLMEKMRDNGVNFWIVGLETVDPQEHELLRRPYRHDALTMVDMALKTFSPRSLSFDLLYGIPGQTPASWRRTLEQALAYQPDHLTLLPLRFAGTQLQAACMTGLITAPCEEALGELRLLADQRLTALGYTAYTDVDYCLPGKENRFRLGQISGSEQLGLGYDATTIMDGCCYQNGHSLQEYMTHPGEVEILARDVRRL